VLLDPRPTVIAAFSMLPLIPGAGPALPRPGPSCRACPARAGRR